MCGCYMNIKADDCSRLTSIEQRLSNIEQALGIPSPPPVQTGRSDSNSDGRVNLADYEDRPAEPSAMKNVPRATRRSSVAEKAD